MNSQEQPTDKKLTPIQEKRAILKELSIELRKGMEEGEKLNDHIIEHYKEENPEIEEFNTYKGWRKKGFQVKKGETAFLVWGRPKEDQEAEQNSEAVSDSEDNEKFYPVAFIFSNLQVREIEKKEAA